MKKLLGEQRRESLLALLKSQNGPLKGTDLAKYANVSRQVIVNDMNLLKARNEPIMATSQGYLYFPIETNETMIERKIVCLHDADNTKNEMYAIVDCGVTIKNVIVQHPVYGEIVASIMVANRMEVDRFLQRVESANASLLSALTDGTHLHLLTAPSEQAMVEALSNLRALGILVEN